MSHDINLIILTLKLMNNMILLLSLESLDKALFNVLKKSNKGSRHSGLNRIN